MEGNAEMSGSPTKDLLDQSVKDAMRAKDRPRLSLLRMATSALKQIEIDERIELDDKRVIATLEKMIKQRKDAATQFDQGERADLAEQERFEITILQEFMPTALSEDEVNTLINNAITETGAGGMKDMGKVMGLLKPLVQGRADMGAVSQKIKSLLG